MTLPPYVAILGAGHCGCAMAAELSSRGGSVILHSTPDHQRHLADIRREGGLSAEAEVTGRFHPALTTDIDEALGAADYVVITVPSYGHDDILALLRDKDLSRHTLVFINGTFIALRAARELNARAVLETNASPFASRVVDGTVRVSGIKNGLPIGGLPGIPDPATVAEIEAIFPGTLDWYDNVLEIGMQSNNGVIHPPATLLNAGWIETTGGDFYFYRDGMSPSVSRIVEVLDEERLRIARAYGLEVKTVLEEMIDFYGTDYPTFCEFASKSEPHNIIRVAPGSMTDRFVSEDIPFILVPWYELGLLAGVEARMMRSMIDIASTMNGIDYMREGRSLASLGLAGMSRDDILTFCGSVRGTERSGVRAAMGAIPAPVAGASRAQLVSSGAQ